jgi:hypothetical protein
MILKFEILERKSEARGAYGFRCDWSVLVGRFFEREPDVPRFPLVVWTPLVWTPLVLFVSGTWTISLFSAGEMSQVGHILKDDRVLVYNFFLGGRLIMYVFYIRL